MSRPNICRLVVICLHCVALSLAAGPIGAAESAPSAVRQTFAPESFARFAPRTALDMAQQVPGFIVEEGGESRGFGQADTNVLINGRRISGKSNGPLEALSRISANSVLRLEILDGASLDLSGLSGQVLNVVTKTEGRINGRYRYSPQVRSDGVPFRNGNAEVSVSGGKQGSEWALSLLNDQQRFGTSGPEFVRNGAGVTTDERDETVRVSFDAPGVAGSFTRVSEQGAVFNFTGEVNEFSSETSEVSLRNPLNATANVRTLLQSEDEINFELGVDYAFDVAFGRLKVIGLYRYEDSPTEDQVDFSFADGSPLIGTLFERRGLEAEAVLRGEFAFTALGGDLQWSLEGAQNFLDTNATLLTRDDTGLFIPQPLPGASSRVEEDRAEMTLSYGRALTSAVQLQASIGAEFSAISQLGEFGQSREFVRPNGFVSLNWRASQGLDLSLQVERQVGQLNFSDFISSINVNQDRVNVTNTDLVPPQSWVVNVQLQRSLGEFGSVTLAGFYEDISDIVDLIPIAEGGQAPGNIDTANRSGGSLNSTLLFDPLGWRGARFDIEAAYTDSEVIDPVLGNQRRISDDAFVVAEATLRWDFPGTTWAVGFTAEFEENRPQVRLDEISVEEPSKPLTFLFVEQKDLFGLTLRGTLINLNNRSNDFFRTTFVDRLVGDINFSEDRFREFGLLFRLDIEGSF